VAILLIWSVLLGAVLRRFFKALVLVPACAFVLAAVVVRSVNGEHGLLRLLLEFAVLITSLQIGYVFGLVSHSIPSVSERREPRPRRRLEPRHQPAPRLRLVDSRGRASHNATDVFAGPGEPSDCQLSPQGSKGSTVGQCLRQGCQSGRKRKLRRISVGKLEPLEAAHVNEARLRLS
jgi:hypothetical protein